MRSHGTEAGSSDTLMHSVCLGFSLSASVDAGSLQKGDESKAQTWMDMG